MSLLTTCLEVPKRGASVVVRPRKAIGVSTCEVSIKAFQTIEFVRDDIGDLGASKPGPTGVRQRRESNLSNSSFGCNDGFETLVFLQDEIRELIIKGGHGTDGQQNSRTYSLSNEQLRVAGQLSDACLPIYEPTTDSILFVEKGTAIKRLDSDNVISLVAGCETESGNKDGCGWMARFQEITALMADGKGSIYVSDYSNGQCSLRVLLIWTGHVCTLKARGRVLGLGPKWRALSYDVEANMMVGASTTAIYHMTPYGSELHCPEPPVVMRLVAGNGRDKEEEEDGSGVDGKGMKARFKSIYAIHAASNSRVLVVDSAGKDKVNLRVVDADGTVRTVATFDGSGYETLSIGVLPKGELVLSLNTKKSTGAIVIVSGANFAPSSQFLPRSMRHYSAVTWMRD
ncbi:hypothetical protein VOLCADRAFT_105424 [Volvox carteri f. nagariensis]|uniref:Uncharacterized protein n=1 Tax=Volvox carteri f. nagariensis TaxID=3068 RepID=D8U0P9_VOLCA|nr:uncharacterized protein VOLCADRAFT_105424 [Volvox carteri f. nagariensis]EFJ46675.1 hypothetical protein VOLCADRAFT_105424 [Volvox carteri f. nagariensis]|eukprot:XP_002952204.1 hypothetical protein VOLCADRAFT_105424 [Volvox carteri f. nagariensis]